MDTTVATSTETIQLAVFYKNTFPKSIDTSQNVRDGKWVNVYPKWWDGIVHVDVPLQSWTDGLVTVETIENYM